MGVALKTAPLCPQCGEDDPEKFYRDRSTSTGYCCWCKKCFKKYEHKRVPKRVGVTRLGLPLDAKLTCSKCKKSKEDDEFPLDRDAQALRRHRRGRSYLCRECDSLDQMCRRYGISIEQYLEMEKAQQGLCAICGHEERMTLKRTGLPRRLSVDHCHESGKVRGLLCGPCNQAIGHFRDDPATCIRAGEYLKNAGI